VHDCFGQQRAFSVAYRRGTPSHNIFLYLLVRAEIEHQVKTLPYLQGIEANARQMLGRPDGSKETVALATSLLKMSESMDPRKDPKPCKETSLLISKEFAEEFWTLASTPSVAAATRDDELPQWWRLPTALVDRRPQRTTSTPMPTRNTPVQQGEAMGTR
jgi:hypothetical protein